MEKHSLLRKETQYWDSRYKENDNGDLIEVTEELFPAKSRYEK